MPTAFYSALTYQGAPLPFAINYALLLIAVFSLYELGYITNDTEAIHREEQPAIRLYEQNFAHFAKYRFWIYLAHIGCALIATCILCAYNHAVLLPIIACEVAVLVLFAAYNRWRSKYNVWLYPILVFSRYLPFMLLYEFDWFATLMLFISFPLLNWLERFSMPRYRFPVMRTLIPTEESKTAFRVNYYSLVLIIVLPLEIIYNIGNHRMWLPIFILFVYRLFLLWWLKGHRPKNYLNG